MMNDKKLTANQNTPNFTAQILRSIQIIGSVKHLMLTLISTGVDAYYSWAFKLNSMGLIPMCCFTIVFYVYADSTPYDLTVPQHCIYNSTGSV